MEACSSDWWFDEIGRELEHFEKLKGCIEWMAAKVKSMDADERRSLVVALVERARKVSLARAALCQASPSEQVLAPALHEGYARTCKALKAAEARLIGRLPVREGTLGELRGLTGALAAGDENFDWTSSAALMSLVAGSRRVLKLGDRVTAVGEAHDAKNLVLVGEICPESVSLTPEDGDRSFVAFVEESREVRSRVDASETVIIGRHGHGSMFGLGVQCAERKDLFGLGSLGRDDVEMGGAGNPLGSVADCCMCGGGARRGG